MAMRRDRSCPPLAPLATALLLALPAAHAEEAAPPPVEIEFNSDFLRGTGGQQVDISRFGRGNPVLPGDYLVDVQLNGHWLGRFQVRFIVPPGGGSAMPCIDRSILDQLALDTAKLADDARAALAVARESGCADLAALVPDARIDYDQSRLQLAVSIPQALLRRSARGHVSPEFWDPGVTSATLAYQLNAYQRDNAAGSSSSGYLGLTGGFNFQGWHLRQRGTLTSAPGNPHRYRNLASHALRDIPAWRSTLALGDGFSDGAVFDSIAYRGVALASNDLMLPESMRGYAPVVRGVARSNALVRIEQNGSLLLELNVPAGPFEIDDLYPTGYGGDIVVTVLEADGSQQRFSVPYASVPQLLRPGAWRYSIVLGELRDTRAANGDRLAQATLQRGLGDRFTGYGGVLSSGHYRALLLGSAFNTGIGAFAVDVTSAEADIPRAGPQRGHGLRLGYSNQLPATGTVMMLSANRHSSRGYWTFADTLAGRQAVRAGLDADAIHRPRERLLVLLSQPLGARGGALFLSGSSQRYRGREHADTQYQAGYSNSLSPYHLRIGYNLALGRQRDPLSGRYGRHAQFSLSFPLGSSPRAPSVSASLSHDVLGGGSRRMGQQSLHGSLGRDNTFGYGLSASQQPRQDALAANIQYRGSHATVSAGASRSGDYRQHSFGAMGAVVWHRGGLGFANQAGDTLAVIEAPGAEGARVANQAGTRIDRRGHAVVSQLVPYRMNTVRIDPEGSGFDVEFRSTSQQVAPYAHSVARIRFETTSGRAVLFRVRRADGSAVPFGSNALDANGAEVGLVGQDGQLFVRGVEERGWLRLAWGDGEDQQCRFGYQLPADAGERLLKQDATCTADDP